MGIVIPIGEFDAYRQAGLLLINIVSDQFRNFQRTLITYSFYLYQRGKVTIKLCFDGILLKTILNLCNIPNSNNTAISISLYYDVLEL